MAVEEEAIKTDAIEGKGDKVFGEFRYFTPIFITFVLMAVSLIYIWSHTYMTELEYQVAEELSIKERLIEEQKRLKLEYATLKSPKRIAAIAKNQLQMDYPEENQVILLK